MKKNLVIMLAAAGLAVAAVSAEAAPGAYVQAQAGAGKMNTKKYSQDNNPFNKVERKNKFAYRISGGYLWGTGTYNYGVEAGYAKYHNNKYQQTGTFLGNTFTDKETYEGSNIDVLGVGRYNFAHDQNGAGAFVVGKAGVAYLTQKFKDDVQLDGETGSGSKTKHKLAPEVVLGGGYDFNKTFSMDVSYDHIFAGKADPNGSSFDKVSSVDTLMVGAAYHFS